MLKNVKPVRLFQILGLALILAFSCALAGCGSSTPEAIIGTWQMNAVKTADMDDFLQRTGSATADKDGNISIELDGTTILTGTWTAVPKDQWPESTATDEVAGVYEMSLEIPNETGTTSWMGYIIKPVGQNRYALGIFATGVDISLYFARDI